MFVDGWRLIVARGPVLDNQRQWESWLRSQPVPPLGDDVRIDEGLGPDGDWNQYWVRGRLPLAGAYRVVVVSGNFDPRRRKNNTVLGRCDDPSSIAALLNALATTTGERPFLMTPGSPTIAFLSDRSQLISTVTVVAGKWIRSPLWSGDAPLDTPNDLAAWLSSTVER